MMRKLLSLFVCLLFMSSQLAYANDCPACTVYIIKKGKRAPEDGVLYNNMAHATEQARKAAKEDEIKNELEHKHKLEVLDLKLATATTAIALESLQFKYKEVTTLKNDHIKFLEEQLVEADKKAGSDNSTFWLVIGIGTGVLATGFAVWGAGQLGKSF